LAVPEHLTHPVLMVLTHSTTEDLTATECISIVQHSQMDLTHMAELYLSMVEYGGHTCGMDSAMVLPCWLQRGEP
jgi:hypothetical protein